MKSPEIPNFNDAYLFAWVVKKGSFSGASRELSIPLSTVSDRVASLEKALGVALLIRTTRKLKLTDGGLEYFRKADSALSLLTEAQEQVTRFQQAPKGVLRISGPNDFASQVLAEAIIEYRGRFPGVQVETYLTNRHVDLVAENFDIAIRGGSLRDSSLIARRVGADHSVLVASDAYLAKSARLTHPRDLESHACVRFLSHESEQTEDTWALIHRGDKGRARIRPDFATSSTSFLVLSELAKSGAGIGLIPRHLIKGDLASGRLKQVLPMWTTKTEPVHIVYPAQRYASVKVKEMVPLLERRLKELLN